MENNNPSSAAVSVSSNASGTKTAAAGSAAARISAARPSFAVQLFALLKLYSRYMIRSVLNKGILRRKEIRWAAAALALLWIIGDFVGVYVFFSHSMSNQHYDNNEVNMMYAGSIPGILPCCIIIFVIFKTLFGKATGLAELAEQLPVTGRIKAVSFQIFEMLSMLIVFVLMLPGMFGGTVAMGATAIRCFSLYMILLSVLFFAVFNVVWQAVYSFLAFLKLSRYASICLTCVFIVLDVVAALNVNNSTLAVHSYFVSGNGRITFFTLIPELESRAGFVPCALLLVAGIAVLLFLALLLTSKYYQAPEGFVYIPLPGVAKNDFMLFLAYVVRLQLNVETLFLCVGLQLSGYFSHSYGNILIYSAILTFAAAYQFANGIEEQWRMKRGGSAGWLYLCLLVSQILYAGFFWLVSSAVLAVSGHLEPKDCLSSFVAIVAGSIIFTFLGIVFPSAKNNPFTIVAGAASIMLLILALALGEQAFNLNNIVMYSCRTVGLAVLAVYSVWAIQDNIKRRKIGKG